VKGPNAHPFYKWAAEARPKDVPRWNFHKYLIGRDGYIADVFPETIEPTDTRVKNGCRPDAGGYLNRARINRSDDKSTTALSAPLHWLGRPN